MQKHKYFISDIAATTDPTQVHFFPSENILLNWGGEIPDVVFISAPKKTTLNYLLQRWSAQSLTAPWWNNSVYLCVFLLERVCFTEACNRTAPPTYPPSQLLPAHTSQYLVKVFIKCAVMGWRLPPPQLSCSLDITCAPTSLWSPLLLHYGYGGTKIPLSWLHLWMWKTYAVVSHPVLWKPKITTSNEKKEVNLGSFCSSLPGILYLLQESTALEHSALTSILGEENRKNPELPSDEK